MFSRKFWAIVLWGLLLFTALFVSGGCISDDNDHKNTSNNPAPQGTVVTDADYIAGNIAIGFQNGDNPDYVTGNLTLPESVSTASTFTVSWSSSNPSVISAQGLVNRQASDTTVTMTARVTNGTDSATREFILNVIRRRSRSIEQAKSEIQVNGLDEIRSMNVSNDELNIRYSESRDRVTDIDGKYASFTVSNADDALDAVQSLHGILGINDPYEELDSSVNTQDEYGGEYTFSQVYNGVRVYGRNLTASANKDDETDFITSNIIPSATLAGANLNFTYTKAQAENAALSRYSGNANTRTNKTEQVIYSLGSYENNPVPAYVVNVYGTNASSQHFDENVIVNALIGEIITASSNLLGASGTDELDNIVDFPVEDTIVVVLNGNEPEEHRYYMRNKVEGVGAYLEMYSVNAQYYNMIYRLAGQDWDDRQAVSAYTNMIDIMQWWKSEFNRNSLNGQGMTVKVIVHAGQEDNAWWNGGSETISIPDPVNNIHSYAAALEVMVHESTHAVFQYRIDTDFPYENATGAINEAYADIFGCIMTKQWEIGNVSHRDGQSMRNIREGRTMAQMYADGNTEVHVNSMIISHVAHLMKEHNISWEDLGKVWYKSMRMGYNSNSDYYTVRRNVLRAAKKLGMSESNKSIIKWAFDQVGIGEVSGNISGKITDIENSSGIANVEMNFTLEGNTQLTTQTWTDNEGKYYHNLTAGTYTITAEANGYIPFTAHRVIEEGDELELNIALVRQGRGTIKGYVRNALTGDYLSGVTVRIREGWNLLNRDTGATTRDQYAATVTQQTNANGYYEMSNVQAGYYTLEASMYGYNVSPSEIIIAPGSDASYEILLSPTMTSGQYRVTLQWDANPRDLDSHLVGPLPSGNTFHVYYYDKIASYNGSNVAVLDHDDTQGNGFETITFEMQPGDRFIYYVHWFAGSGTWAGSNAVVRLYKGTQLIGTFTVPEIDEGISAGRFWHVFDLTSGLNPVVPSISITTYAPSVNASGISASEYFPMKNY